MTKKMLSLAMAMAFVASTATMSFAAKSATCEVKSVDGSTVTLDCKDAGSLKAGDNVKVKKAKSKAIEGC